MDKVTVTPLMVYKIL